MSDPGTNENSVLMKNKKGIQSLMENVKSMLKNLLLLDLAIAIIVTCGAWSHLGVDGMAEMFCESIGDRIDKCEDI